MTAKPGTPPSWWAPAGTAFDSPRYGRMLCFFNLAGAVYDPDVDGIEIASLGGARIEAARYLGEVIRDQPEVVWAGEEVRVEVTDADQLVLFTIIVFGVDAPATSNGPASFRSKV